MLKIDSALPSPRIVNGIIEWYAMDTFELSLKLNLKDADGSDVTLGTDDTVTVTIRNDRGETVKEFEFTGATGITNNSIPLTFDETVSSAFPQGLYFYDIVTEGERRVTIAKDNRIKVR